MATNNPNNDPLGSQSSGHPEDMLEAFALDALDLEEELSIQDHLDGCDQCSDVVDRFQATAAELAGSVTLQDPPAGLRARVMQAVSREEPLAPAAPEPQLVPQLTPPLGDRLMDSRLVRMLVPLGASVAMVLVVIAVTMNVRITNN